MNDIKYVSTRGGGEPVSASVAITDGIAPDGGLYFPDRIPKFDIAKFRGLSYKGIAYEVFRAFLSDFTDGEVKDIVNKSYRDDNFDTEEAARLVRAGNRYILELWHGPTCAFKDMALQALPHLLRYSAAKVFAGGEPKQVKILTATSGDTGKAALEGFKNVEGVDITVYYPADGVSEMQKRQMTTQDGNNVNVIAVRGNFDDCQSAVKSIFADNGIRAVLARKNAVFSSANSINWGRLLPQIVYYFYAYIKLTDEALPKVPKRELYSAGKADEPAAYAGFAGHGNTWKANAESVVNTLTGGVKFGNKINFAVPTGNFGNILAGYIAMEAGLPVNKLICCSNRNNVLSDFINTGVYDVDRRFHCTVSPSMDILVSSNLERALYYFSDRDTAYTANLMKGLKDNGAYKVSGNFLSKFRLVFSGLYCNDEETLSAVKAVFEKERYLADTHTAVALRVHDMYAETNGDETPTVVLSTAHPYKFGSAVYSALTAGTAAGAGRTQLNEYDVLRRLKSLTGVEIPQALAATEKAVVRFSDKNVVGGADIIADFMRRLA